MKIWIIIGVMIFMTMINSAQALSQDIYYLNNEPYKNVSGIEIDIYSPMNARCSTTDPTLMTRDCFLEGEVLNKMFYEPRLNSYSLDFEKTSNIEATKIFYSTEYDIVYQTYKDDFCSDANELKEEKDDCTVTIEKRVYKNWLNGFPKKIPIGYTGFRFEFRDTLETSDGEYLDNFFNITINDVKLDPTISACADITAAGTYTMDGDILGETSSACINITTDDVIFDCAGHTIDADNVADGGIYIRINTGSYDNITIENCIMTDWDSYNIYLYHAHNVTIRNVSLEGDDQGIQSWYSDGMILEDSIIDPGPTGSTEYLGSSSDYGIFMYNSDSCVIRNVDVIDGAYGIGLSNGNFYLELTNISINTTRFPILSDYSSSNRCTSTEFNNVSSWGKPVLWINETTTMEGWNNNFSEILLCNADNTVINNMFMESEVQGVGGIIIMGDSDGVNITNSTFNYIRSIFYHGGVTSGLVYNNTFYDTEWGIYGYGDPDGVLIEGNNFSEMDREGIFVRQGSSNEVRGNYFYATGSAECIQLDQYADDWLIYNNDFYKSITSANTWVNVDESGNLFNVTQQEGNRIIGDGTEVGGNAWRNASGGPYYNCSDVNQDGFCDDSFSMDSGLVVDYLPLSDEWTGEDLIPPIITVDNPQNDTYTCTDVINFNVTIDDNGDWCGASIDGGANITMTSTGTFTYGLIQTLSNATHYVQYSCNDTDGNMNDSSVITYFTVNVSSCSGTPDTCDTYTNESACNTCGCTWAGSGWDTYIYDSFEVSEGNWTNDHDMSDTDDWSRDNLGTPSSTTGPCEGSSSCGYPAGADGTDYYMFVETSSGYCFSAGETAILWLSPEINFTEHDGSQINFSYNMYGADIGTLTLQENTTGSWLNLWSKTGNQGTDWFNNITSLDSLNDVGHLRFNYACAGGYWGDAAIDEIRIQSPGSYTCTGTPTPCCECSDENCTFCGCTFSGEEPPISETCYDLTSGKITVPVGCKYEIETGEGESR